MATIFINKLSNSWLVLGGTQVFNKYYQRQHVFLCGHFSTYFYIKIEISQICINLCNKKHSDHFHVIT